MEKYYKFLFLFFVVLFSIIVIVPALDHQDKTTDIIFFGVDKADSILVKNKDVTILIDTGLSVDKKRLSDKLKRLGIRKIDYLILTHPDKDHIGGASHIIETFTVENLIQSNLDSGSKNEAKIKNALKDKPTNNIVLKDDLEIDIENFKVNILVPKEQDYKKDNDYSLVTLIEDRDLNYLFAADAEKVLLKELLNRDLPTIDLYKVAHHGRYNSNSIEFINKIKPKISVVTNSFAEDKVLSALNKVDSEIYFAFDKDVHITSDGKELKVR